MKVDFDTVLTNLSGEELKENDKKHILKDISINSLMANIQQQGDNPEAGTVKIKRYELARKINDGGVVEVTAEEITMIKERVGIVMPTMVMGSVYDILEKKSEPKGESDNKTPKS